MRKIVVAAAVLLAFTACRNGGQQAPAATGQEPEAAAAVEVRSERPNVAYIQIDSLMLDYLLAQDLSNAFQAKANKAAADELEKLKESQMSETEKAAKRTQELEAQVAAYKAKEQQAEWKTQVSAKTGIPAEALRGSTLEEIQAHADILKPLMHPAPKLPNVPNPAQHPAGQTADERAKAYVRSLFGNKD